MSYPAVSDPCVATRLASHFQPILSLSHQRVVGHEALLRGTGEGGQPISPLALFSALDEEGQRRLDRRAVALHLRSFAAQREAGALHHWLFLNLRPATFLEIMAEPSEMLLQRLAGMGCEASDLVVEVTEDSVGGLAALEAASREVRAIGCLLALDDFGAGHSNFDRVWRLEPDIVKLDRSLVQRAAREPRAARIVAQMVSLLHECGALVLMEGIETEDEAQLSLDCDVDLVQGYFFGRPQAAMARDGHAGPQLSGLWERFQRRQGTAMQSEHRQLAPYMAAIAAAARDLQQGMPLGRACEAFLRLPRAQLCYELDEGGLQFGDSVLAVGRLAADRRRFAPLHDAAQACWARRPYFLRALETPGTVQVTRPYLSMQGTGLCFTLSIAVRRGEAVVVLCGDVGLQR